MAQSAYSANGGEFAPSTFTEQPKPTTRHGELSEIAHHKDGDSSHGFSAEIDRETPGSHDHSPDA